MKLSFKNRVLPAFLSICARFSAFAWIIFCGNNLWAGNFLSAEWMQAWNVPTCEMRPLKIIHGQTIDDKLITQFLDSCGIGGVVVNVPFSNGYIRNDENWKVCVRNIKKAREAGLRVWIYDELAWPSLRAGGVVLEQDPSLESLELAYDPETDEPFQVRPSYEFTFASMDTLRDAIRHPNPLDPKAVAKFIEVTHERYRKELGPELYHQIEAFFTDEPTMLGISLLPIITPEKRKACGVVDPLDWNKKILATVPWSRELEKLYFEAYQEELRPNFISLFAGDSENDRKIRKQFWSLVGALNADTYFGGLRRFCESDSNGPISSGHTLVEENLVLNVPLDGNKLAVLKQFQLPGQDLLNSEPAAQFRGHWLTHAFPASAAYLIGQRKIMTEVSDHIQRHHQNRMASIDEMLATAGIMSAWGITEFTLYYSINGGKDFPERNERTFKIYCDFVGKMNSVLRSANPVRPVILYYPIEVVQEGYVPNAGKYDGRNLSPRTHQTALSFASLGKALAEAQIPFIIADDQTIRELIDNGAGKSNNSRTVRKDTEFTAVIYPIGVKKKEYQWNQTGIKEFWAMDFAEEPEETQKIIEQAAACAGPRLKMEPQTSLMALGAFVRDGKFIFSLTNADKNDYSGCGLFTSSRKTEIPLEGEWKLLDPHSGEISSIKPENGKFPLRIEAGKTKILISP